MLPRGDEGGQVMSTHYTRAAMPSLPTAAPSVLFLDVLEAQQAVWWKGGEGRRPFQSPLPPSPDEEEATSPLFLPLPLGAWRRRRRSEASQAAPPSPSVASAGGGRVPTPVLWSRSRRETGTHDNQAQQHGQKSQGMDGEREARDLAAMETGAELCSGGP